jgi:signal transduction histidine kinase/CheY-like chemotaxis protein/ligand-binding sensor domain-containing protein
MLIKIIFYRKKGNLRFLLFHCIQKKNYKFIAMRKVTPNYSLLIIAIAASYILPSCNNKVADIPFPLNDSGYAQPVILPLQFSAPKKLNWVTIKTGAIKPEIKKLDIDALPTTPYDASGFKPFSKPPGVVQFNFNALPDTVLNLDKVPSKSLKFKTSVLPPPIITKTALLSPKSGATLSIFDLTQSLSLRGKVIFCFLQDKSGLIWIGTDKGICRFDGEYLQTYSSLHSRGFIEDNNARIWFINSEGIGMIDTRMGLINFSSVINAPFPLLPKMILDSNGSLWVSETASRSVQIIDPQAQSYKQLDKNTGISGTSTYGIFEDRNKNIWLNTNAGIDIINLKKGKISYLKKINGLQSDTIRAITGDKKGRIWVGARNGGVDVVDIEQGSITNYSKLQGLENANIYRRLVIDNKDRVWISVDQRLAIIDPGKGMMKYFAENEGTPHDYNLDLLLDNKQRIWVGTSSSGLYIIDQDAQMVYPLGKKNLSTLFEDAVGNIWAGTTNEGIYILNGNKQTERQLNKQQGFDNNIIQSFTEVDGNIWVTSNGGFDIIDQAHKTIEHTGRKEGLVADTVYSILKDDKGNIWLTGPGEGIEIIDSAKTSIRHAGKTEGLSDNNILNIKKDKQGRIWLATLVGGVDVIDPETWTIQYLNNTPGLKDSCYRTIMPDKQDRMWIATDKGIYIADTKQGKLISISTAQGLSNDYITSLIEYNNQVVAGTYHKVNIITPPTVVNNISAKASQGKWAVSQLAKSDGLSLSQPLWDVNIITKKGQYLWGDLGITIINDIKEDHDSATTYITGINVMNKPQVFANTASINGHDTLWSADSFYVKGQTPVNTGYGHQNVFHWDTVSGPYNIPTNLIIPYDRNYIQFQFAQANFGSQDSTLYSYILEGIDKQWGNFTNKTFTDNYLNLSPGNYTFKVRSKASGGLWGKPVSFGFTITPPWWETWWAYTLYVLCIIALLYAFIRYRTYQLHAKQKELEIKVEERTLEVKQQAEELATVNQISQALAAQLNIGDLITLVGDQLLKLFKANIVYVALLDTKKKVINFPYQHGDNMPPMNLGEGLTSKIILTGQSLLINKDVHEKTSELGVSRIGVPSASYLGVPIPVGDEIIGVMSVQSTEIENRFNEKDQRLLTTIAANVGVALKKAGLFEEVKQAKMEAEAARKTAEQANAAKSAFLSTVSHELRTPLTSILGFAKIIKKRLEEKVFPLTDKTDPKTNKTVQQISENLNVVVAEGERLTHLINDVLDLAKIEAGKMEWNMEPVPMAEIVERAIAATTALFDQKNLILERQIEDSLPEITGDRDKLIQVVVNLLSNAVKFTETGAVTCHAFKRDNNVVVGISDTGIGIAPEDYNAVFEQFKQVGDTLTDKPKGTGLGLPICKEIVEHHGGQIWLESELGKGSTFFFSLPFIKTDATEKKPLQFDDLLRQLKKRVEQSHPSVNGSHGTILVVDDEEGIRSLLRQELTEAGYNIEEAANGKEALAKIRKVRPDLILLDVMMPEMNGFDVAAILKNDPQTMDIPIIILSIVQDKARGYRIGVDRYLTKPIDTGLLFSEIGHLLEQGKSRKKVMVVDEDSVTARTLTEVLQAKGYQVVESDGKELVQKAIANQPDIIILNSILSGNQEIVKTLRFEKGLENVLFLIYQ